MIDDLIPQDMNVESYRKPKSLEKPNANSDKTSPEVKCDIEEISKGPLTRYIAPPGAAPPGAPGAPPGAVPPPTPELMGILEQILKELHEHRKLFKSIEDYLSVLTNVSPTGTYFEISTQTTVATPTTPSADTITNGIIPGYDFVEINNRLQGRNATQLWVVNDGPPSPTVGDNLFVRTSSDGKAFSPEFTMIVGEVRKIYDVYEVRFRSPKIANVLRMSEREIIPPYVTTVTNTSVSSATANRPHFLAQRVAVGVADAILPVITVPDGFSLAIRANVNNAAGSQIFISDTDATVATGRTILNVGDTVGLSITNANLVHVAGSVAGQFVDILVEQN